jgi:ABC-type antimicrobial peptide transport system, ATPase component
MSFLQFKDVCKNYGSGKNITEVLANINLEIEDGEFVAIVGFQEAENNVDLFYCWVNQTR